MLKFATRAVCDYPHEPWDVLTTAGPSQRNDPPQGQIPGPRRRRDTPARGHTMCACAVAKADVAKADVTLEGTYEVESIRSGSDIAGKSLIHWELGGLRH